MTLDTILSTLNDKNPFDDHPVLMDIMAGVNSTTAVNVDDAKNIDDRIIDSSHQSNLDQSKFQLIHNSSSNDCKTQY